MAVELVAEHQGANTMTTRDVRSRELLDVDVDVDAVEYYVD